MGTYDNNESQRAAGNGEFLGKPTLISTASQMENDWDIWGVNLTV